MCLPVIGSTDFEMEDACVRMLVRDRKRSNSRRSVSEFQFGPHSPPPTHLSFLSTRERSMSSRVDGGAPRVKNRAAAAVQITAEQLLREVRQTEVLKDPNHGLTIIHRVPRPTTDRTPSSKHPNNASKISKSLMNIEGESGKSLRSGFAERGGRYGIDYSSVRRGLLIKRKPTPDNA